MPSRLRAIAITLMFALSLSVIVITILSDKDPASTAKVWLSIGSNLGAALLGASLAMLIELALGTEVKDIRDYLFAKEKFESPPDHLDVVSASWQVYYLTQSGAATKWKHTIYNLRRGDTQNVLRGSFSVLTDRGERREYRIEAGLRGSTLIAISRADSGTEREAVEVVPLITHKHLSTYVGVQLLETWDGNMALSHSLFSRTPLVEGDPSSPTNQRSLDEQLAKVLETQKITYLLQSTAS